MIKNCVILVVELDIQGIEELSPAVYLHRLSSLQYQLAFWITEMIWLLVRSEISFEVISL